MKIDRYQHKYVIGIDFGHGETSAAISEIDWDKVAGQSEQRIDDIIINPGAKFNEKVLVSAICKKADGSYIEGGKALEAENLEDGSKLRIGFKQPPSDINGQSERLMIQFMNLVYKRIRSIYPDKLDDHNHVVYIARPSGWKYKEARELYIQMAQEAKIPLAGLTSESRAAFFYANNHVNIGDGFNKTFKRGGLIFDLGSSTLDFTYISNDGTIKEHGYPIGASYIDQAIYKHIFLQEEYIDDFIRHYPQLKDKLLYEARMVKEIAFYQSKIDLSIEICSLMPEDHPDKEMYKDKYIKVKFKNGDELNSFCNKNVFVDPFNSGNTIGYLDGLKKAMIDFQETHIPSCPINGVFYTGGASRMGFIKPLIQECFNLDGKDVLTDQNDPSLTVSRGIAALGVANAKCELLIEQLNKKIEEKTSLPEIEKMIIPNPLEVIVDFDVPSTSQTTLIEILAEQISASTWKMVDSACHQFVRIRPNESLKMKDLESLIRDKISYYEKK